MTLPIPEPSQRKNIAQGTPRELLADAYEVLNEYKAALRNGDALGNRKGASNYIKTAKRMVDAQTLYHTELCKWVQQLDPSKLDVLVKAA